VTYQKINESFYNISGTPEQLQEIKRKFTVKIPNAYFDPMIKRGLKPDSEVFYLPNGDDIILPAGLVQFISKFGIIPIQEQEFFEEDILEFIESLNIPFPLYDYQEKMVVDSLVHKQQLCLAATGSGKSLVIYCIVSFLYKHKKKGIILVPSVSLTTQIFEDFKDYGCSEEFLEDIRLIGGDNNIKEFDKQITITTWQSAQKMTQQLNDIDFILVDEAHGLKFENKSTDIVYNAINATYRIGLTGTLPDCPIAKMSILACVGAPKRYIRTQGLIERGLATPVHINVLKLRYSNEDQALFKYVGNYTKKLKFIKEHANRNMFISKMSHAVSKIGNTVIMCSHTEHMKDIFKELMEQKFPDVEVENKNITGAKAFEFQNKYGIYYIAGATKVKDRVKIISILKGHTRTTLTFGDIIITVNQHEKIPLSDGSEKEARYITTEDDVSDEWIKNNK
jgi:superfamily II DNA or RNA helicase